MAQIKREDVDKKYKWAVEDIYANDKLWEEDLNKLSQIAANPCKYKGELSKDSNNIYEALKESDETDYLLTRVYVYAFMKYYEDTQNSKYQEMSGKAQSVAIKMSEKYAFLEPEILSLDEESLREDIKKEPLSFYGPIIEDMLLTKEHSLSEKEEMLLAKAANISSVASETFSKFNNADIKFEKALDEKGEEHEVTNGQYGMLMESGDRTLRKNAFNSLYASYKANINTISSLFYGNVKQAVFFADVRKYNSSLERYLSASFIPTSVYTNLVNTVNNNLNLMHKYVELRKKALGVDELHFYDVYAPMVADYKWEVSYEEAKEMALKALEPLGEEYVNTVRTGYENGWVDVYENEGKRSGAFSWGCYGTHPYIFLNYTNTLNDVFTLIHETGHAMHTYYSNKTQSFAYSGYKIFVAEVASTVNESLLMQYLLKNCKDKDQKKYLLNHYFEQFKGTLYRQTMFAEFEMKAHEMVENGEVLSAKNLNDLYLGLNKKYFGDEMVMDDNIAYEWARIPHFYTPFYVYQYATGYSAAIAISLKILEGDNEVIEGYKNFLKSGSSLHPIETLKLAKVDMTKPEVVEDALKVFKDVLNQWENL
ncbi:oligoendopeptidase F [Lachnospira multipara]|uniref:oligoendopeptidase F n=1 Tax=Lachnospira multipara TaxID=28051 RepID=UPI0004836295|nr:oligoendopeptidase F [Lachnospira multipara]